MNEILAAHTGRPIEEIAQDTERDYHMNGEEALDYGLIDRVVLHREGSPGDDPEGAVGGKGGKGGNGSSRGE